MIPNSAKLVLSQSGVLILSILGQIIIARTLGPELRGQYALTLSYVSIISFITFHGLEYSLRYRLLKNEATFDDVSRHLQSHFVTSTVLSGVIAIPIAVISGLKLNLLFAGTIFTNSLFLSKQQNVLLTISQEFSFASIMVFVEELLRVVFVGLMVYLFQAPVTVFLVGAMVNLITYGAYVKRKKIPLRGFQHLALKERREQFGFGVRAGALTLSNLVFTNVGNLIIGGRIDNSVLGHYSLSNAMASKIQVIPDALNRVVVPLSAQNRDHLHLTRVMLALMLLVSLVFGLVVTFFGKSIIVLTAGVSYSEASEFLTPLSWAYGVRLVIKPMENYFLEIAGKPGAIIRLHAWSVAFVAIATACGFAVSGAIGASYGLLAGYVCLFLLTMRKMMYQTGRKCTSLFAFVDLFKMIRTRLEV